MPYSFEDVGNLAMTAHLTTLFDLLSLTLQNGHIG
jgi:hypothetical protein